MKRVLAVLAGAGIAVGGGAAAWAGTAGAGGPDRDAVIACRDQAREEAPGADRAALRQAVKACLADAGVTPGRLKARRAEARRCLAEVRDAHPDATRAERRELVRECVRAR